MGNPLVREIVRGIAGGTAACIVFLLGDNILIGLICGVVLYAGSFLLTASYKKEVVGTMYDDNSEEYWFSHMTEKGEQYLKAIHQTANVIQLSDIREKVMSCYDICRKILTTAKAKKLDRRSVAKFLRYYLPMLQKIIANYAQCERAEVVGEKTIDQVSQCLIAVEAAMQKQLENMYQSDMLDMTTDMEVLKNMVKSDGLLGSDFTFETGADGQPELKI